MAAVIESWFRQDLQKPVQVHYLDGSLFSNNGNGNRIGVELTNGGEDYTVTGTVSGYAVLADGSTVPCTGAKSGNKASILVPPAAYLPGNIFITIFLTDGTTVTTLAAVSSTVIQARTDNQVSPGSVVTDWTNTINAALQTVEGYTGNIIATPYASLTYPVPLGKYCIYNDNLYRCISPIASSESWTASHWVQVKLADDVSDLKSALLQKSCVDNEDDGYAAFIHDMIISAALKWYSTSSGTHLLIPVKPGDSVKVKGNANRSTYLAMLTDYVTPVHGVLVPMSTATGFTDRITVAVNTEVSVTVPSDANWLYIMKTASGNNHMPVSVTVNGYSVLKGTRKEIFDQKHNLEQEIDYVQNELDGTKLVDIANSEITHHASPTIETKIKLPTNPGTVIFQYTGYADGTSKTLNGVTFTVQQDGSIIINGTPSASTVFELFTTDTNIQFPFDSEKVTFSIVSEQPITAEFYYDDKDTSDPDYKKITTAQFGSYTFTARNRSNYTRIKFRIHATANYAYKNCRVWPMLERGEVNHNIVYYVENKNLFWFDKMRVPEHNDSDTVNGVTYIIDKTNKQVTIKAGSECTDTLFFAANTYSDQNKPFAVGDYVRVSGFPGANPNNKQYYVYCNTKDENNVNINSIRDHYGSATMITEDYYGISTGIRINAGSVFTEDVIVKPQIEVNDISSPFEKNERRCYNPLFNDSVESFEGATNIFSYPSTAFNSEIVLSLPEYIKANGKENDLNLTVCTYNVGLFNYGLTPAGYDGEDLDQKVMAMKLFLADNQIDVLCLQELSLNFSRDESVMSREDILIPMYNAEMKGFNKEYIFSRKTFTDSFKGRVGRAKRGFISISVHDDTKTKEVCIIDTHLTWNSQEEREDQIEDLIDFIRDKEYYIICGDFNCQSGLSELQPFVDLGCKLANGGYFGEYVTVKPKSSDTPTTHKVYDNVIVSPNILITDMKRLDTEDAIPSDHYPLVVKLCIPGHRALIGDEEEEEE